MREKIRSEDIPDSELGENGRADESDEEERGVS